MTAAAVLAVAATGAAVDLRTRRVPDALTLGAALLGLVAALAGLGTVSTPLAVLGAVVGLALMLPRHLVGGIGAGDVKLMAALGAWLGPSLVVHAFLYTAVAGGLFALVVAGRRRRLAATVSGALRLVAMRASAREIEAEGRDNRFPYAPAIGVGCVLAVLGW